MAAFTKHQRPWTMDLNSSQFYDSTYDYRDSQMVISSKQNKPSPWNGKSNSLNRGGHNSKTKNILPDKPSEGKSKKMWKRNLSQPVLTARSFEVSNLSKEYGGAIISRDLAKEEEEFQNRTRNKESVSETENLTDAKALWGINLRPVKIKENSTSSPITDDNGFSRLNRLASIENISNIEQSRMNGRLTRSNRSRSVDFLNSDVVFDGEVIEENSVRQKVSNFEFISPPSSPTKGFNDNNNNSKHPTFIRKMSNQMFYQPPEDKKPVLNLEELLKLDEQKLKVDVYDQFNENNNTSETIENKEKQDNERNISTLQQKQKKNDILQKSNQNNISEKQYKTKEELVLKNNEKKSPKIVAVKKLPKSSALKSNNVNIHSVQTEKENCNINNHKNINNKVDSINKPSNITEKVNKDDKKEAINKNNTISQNKQNSRKLPMAKIVGKINAKSSSKASNKSQKEYFFNVEKRTKQQEIEKPVGNENPNIKYNKLGQIVLTEFDETQKIPETVIKPEQIVIPSNEKLDKKENDLNKISEANTIQTKKQKNTESDVEKTISDVMVAKTNQSSPLKIIDSKVGRVKEPKSQQKKELLVITNDQQFNNLITTVPDSKLEDISNDDTRVAKLTIIPGLIRDKQLEYGKYKPGTKLPKPTSIGFRVLTFRSNLVYTGTKNSEVYEDVPIIVFNGPREKTVSILLNDSKKKRKKTVTFATKKLATIHSYPPDEYVPEEPTTNAMSSAQPAVEVLASDFRSYQPTAAPSLDYSREIERERERIQATVLERVDTEEEERDVSIATEGDHFNSYSNMEGGHAMLF